jgi:hypothetical protein
MGKVPSFKIELGQLIPRKKGITLILQTTQRILHLIVDLKMKVKTNKIFDENIEHIYN